MSNGGGGGQGAGMGGALIGGIFGMAGGVMESIDRERTQRRFMRRQQQGITAARDLTETRVEDLLADPLITAARDYLETSFSEDDDPLSQQFTKRLRVAQEARGLRRGTAGAVAEASSLAAFRQQHLSSLLPQMRSFGTLGEDYRQRILQQEIPWNVAYHTGAAVPGITPPAYIPSALTSGMQGFASGAAGGYQIGSAMGQPSNPYEQYMQEIAANERYTGLQSQLDDLISNQEQDPFADMSFDMFRR